MKEFADLQKRPDNVPEPPTWKTLQSTNNDIWPKPKKKVAGYGPGGYGKTAPGLRKFSFYELVTGVRPETLIEQAAASSGSEELTGQRDTRTAQVRQGDVKEGQIADVGVQQSEEPSPTLIKPEPIQVASTTLTPGMLAQPGAALGSLFPVANGATGTMPFSVPMGANAAPVLMAQTVPFPSGGGLSLPSLPALPEILPALKNLSPSLGGVAGGVGGFVLMDLLFPQGGSSQEVEWERQNKLRQQQQSIPAPTVPVSPSMPMAPLPVEPIYKVPSAPDESEQQRKAQRQQKQQQQQWEQEQQRQEAEFKAQQAAFKAQQAAQKQLSAKQDKLNRLSAGFMLNEEHLKSFEAQLTPSQKGALTKEVNERYKGLMGLAQQADNPFAPYEVAEIKQKIRQQVLYERYVPVREINHFGNKFLDGYTPQKMKAVRGYFDQVFEGNYSKRLPADKRAAILKSADAMYTEETGKKPNREDPLWKTLRNVETSEKFPDLWDQFRQDLSKAPSQPMGIMTGESLPPLGGFVEGPGIAPELLKPESFPSGGATLPPLGGFGEGSGIAPEILKPETFPTNQKVDGVTNVFESSQAKLRYKLGPNDTDLRGSDITFPKALDEAFQRTGIPRDQFKVTKWGRDIYGKSIPVEYEGPGAAEISIDYAHNAPLGKNGEWQTGPDAPHIGWRVGKGTKRQVGHIIIDNVPAGRSSDKE